MKSALWLALGLTTILTSTAVAQNTPMPARPVLRPAPVPMLPRPILFLRSTERYTVGAQKFVRFNYEVTNKQVYAAGLFVPAPTLPPCGANHNSSRTWVDFYSTSSNARLYGFCALTGPNDLDKIWFALPEGTAPPRHVYITITDRQTGAKGRSNNEVTVLTPPSTD